MALSTFAELKASIENWLDRDDLTDLIEDFITLAEDDMFTDLRFREIETELSGTISSGVLAVPADYAELKFAYIDRSPTSPLVRTDIKSLYDLFPDRVSSGIPTKISRKAGNFEFGPFPDSDYSVKGVYYKKFTRLSGSNPDNEVLLKSAGIYLYGALKQAEPYLKNDPRLAVWENEYLKRVKKVNKESKKEDLSGSELEIHAYI
jgi:hypothetical protein